MCQGLNPTHILSHYTKARRRGSERGITFPAAQLQEGTNGLFVAGGSGSGISFEIRTSGSNQQEAAFIFAERSGDRSLRVSFFNTSWREPGVFSCRGFGIRDRFRNQNGRVESAGSRFHFRGAIWGSLPTDAEIGTERIGRIDSNPPGVMPGGLRQVSKSERAGRIGRKLLLFS